MPEIICPKCGTAFTIDEAGYADILKQVRDKDFDRQLHERLEQAERENSKIRELDQAQAEQTLQKTKSAKDAQIQELQAKLKSEQAAKELAVSEALRKVEKEKDDLSAKLDKAESEKQQALDLAEANSKSELQKAAADKDAQIVKLQNRLDAFELQKKQELAQALSAVEKERDDFKGRLERLQLEKESEERLSKEQLKSQLQAVAAYKDSEISELKSSLDKVELQSKVEAKSLKERYEVQIQDRDDQDRDDQIERLRDLKAKLSTKMVGETLEQHCQIEFNKLRSTAFPNAYFEKDNDARTGSKGDFIFRDWDDSGTEIVSIMFEMKNEMDTTSTKHKNEDFFKELDKDRREKDCEYAIMVSLLEPENVNGAAK